MGCALLIAFFAVLSVLTGTNPLYFVMLFIGRVGLTFLADLPFARGLGKPLIRFGWIFILAMAIYIGERWIISTR